jgi:hypothetical protein
MTTTKPLIPARVRDYAYPIALAVVVLLGGYGLISDSVLPAWIALVSAIVGTGTATVYRPAKTLPKRGLHLERD